MRVAILCYPTVALFELACASELFALPRPEFEQWYQCDMVSFEDAPIASLGGLTLQAQTVTSLNGYQMVVIPSWPTAAPTLGEPLRSELLYSELLHAHQRGCRLVSFCSGAFLLGELGVLDGQRATTHWRYAELFQQRFPKVSYVDDVLYVRHGNLACSAGSAAAIDLGLALIREDYGYAIANQVARRLVVSAQRDGGQSQFVETPILAHPNHFAQALDWAIEHLHEPLDIDALAAKAAMSRRTFDRKFRSSFKLSPQQWLTQQRLQLAKQILESEAFAIDKVAQLSGFDNAITLRHHFRKQLGISPSHYRRQFAAS